MWCGSYCFWLYSKILFFQVQQQYPLYSHPCSLQILHEDETSTSVRIPPPPLACFGGIGVKLTATEMRRARMMNKQMSEDCGRQHLALNRTQHHQNQGQKIHSLNFPPKWFKSHMSHQNLRFLLHMTNKSNKVSLSTPLVWSNFWSKVLHSQQNTYFLTFPVGF